MIQVRKASNGVVVIELGIEEADQLIEVIGDDSRLGDLYYALLRGGRE